MKEKSDLVTGTIDVGCIPTLLGDFLPNALDLYHEKHPQVSFNIFHESPFRWQRESPPVTMISASVPW